MSYSKVVDVHHGFVQNGVFGGRDSRESVCHVRTYSYGTVKDRSDGR